jgi:predicted permease
VTPGFFAAMKAPLLRGRDFTEADRVGATDVAIINERLARRFWPDRDPIGQTIRTPEGGDRPDRVRTIVGVARDQKYRSLGDAPRYFVYVPLRQNYLPRLALMLRSARGGAAVAVARAVLREMNPHLPVVNVQSMQEIAGLSTFPQQLAGWVAGGLGAVGLLLTAIGIYGVTAFSAGQRRREIGIRMALGAQRSDVLRMVLRQGMRLSLVGAAAGLLAAVGLSRAIEGFLFGVSAWDPVTFAGSALLLLSVALVACYLPARRATRVDPMVALRSE